MADLSCYPVKCFSSGQQRYALNGIGTKGQRDKGTKGQSDKVIEKINLFFMGFLPNG